jgi:hypothetical protein
MQSAKGQSGLRYLSIWADQTDTSEALIAQLLELLTSCDRVFLIYEEVQGRPHHSEIPITSHERLSSIVREMTGGALFAVLRDLKSFALVPIASNELVIIHDGTVAFTCSAPVQSTVSTDTYEGGDWFAFIEPELSLITA